MLRLVETSQPTAAEIYCSAWARMNVGAQFAFRENEVHYLKTMALSMDDDLASLLLLKKLKLAAGRNRREVGPDIAGMNSCVEFRFGNGNRRFCQLVHPSLCTTSFALSITSRLGAGLIGLRSGQVLLWPDEDGSPRELHVIQARPAGPSNDDDDPPPTAA